MKRLEGKTAIVTGASMGIGQAIARRLHSEGAELVLVSRGREAGEQFAGELGERAHFLAGSVTDPEVADRAVAAAAELGGVDVLVNNAGLDLAQDFLDTDEDDARRIFETNVFGTLWMLRRVARELSERGRGGSIVNIEHMRDDGEEWEVISAPEAHETVLEAIKKAGIATASDEIAMVPKNLTKLEGKNAAAMLRLSEALEEHDNVQNVYSNFNVDEKFRH